ncbi:MAG TPA: DUF1385 domain-containing protein [Candidatus Dormibacteraeota bacterium]|nr:DUF1385 domain-containing protein [Candidatus Dormibacteraeota bacterium]
MAPDGAAAPKSAPVPRDSFFYGGQAVIEGVMMRGRRHYAVAVRVPITREIRMDRGALTAALYTHPVWKLPFLRGLALLVEQLHLGTRSLSWSAQVNAGAQDIRIGRREVAISLTVAVVLSVGLFFGLPLLGASLAIHRSNSFLFVLVEGVIRVALVLAYLSLIALVPDVRRVFQYHGAEHKTINAYEAGWPLEVPAVRRASVLHPRCGTGFLLVVLVVSILLFSLVAVFNPNWFWLITSRVLGIPVIAGVGFEAIRFMARHRYHPVVRVLLLPVLYTQRFTTREPNDDMLEVAIAALNAAREGEEVAASASGPGASVAEAGE